MEVANRHLNTNFPTLFSGNLNSDGDILNITNSGAKLAYGGILYNKSNRIVTAKIKFHNIKGLTKVETIPLPPKTSTTIPDSFYSKITLTNVTGKVYYYSHYTHKNEVELVKLP